MNIVYLFDLELIGHQLSGLDLIEKHDLGNQAVLVTGHYEENDVRSRCQKIGVKLISKLMAGLVPITIRPQNEKDEEKFHTQFVHIDDDKRTRLIWQMEAKKKGHSLISFGSYGDLIEKLDSIAMDATFYIDQELGDGQPKGEEIAKTLFDKGYQNIFLATGYEPEVFADLPYIKGVIGKEPPW